MDFWMILQETSMLLAIFAPAVIGLLFSGSEFKKAKDKAKILAQMDLTSYVFMAGSVILLGFRHMRENWPNGKFPQEIFMMPYVIEFASIFASLGFGIGVFRRLALLKNGS